MSFGGENSGERHDPKPKELIREGPADLEGVRAEASAKPSLTLGNTRSKTKSLSPQTLPSCPQRAEGPRRLPANVQGTKQTAAAACPR